MANPYAVNVGNPLQGIGQIAQVLGQNKQREEQQQAMAQRQAQITDVLNRGDIGEISSYMAANPDLAKGIDQAFNFKTDETRKNMADSAFRILSGEDPQEVIRDRAAFVSQMGGDPSQTLEGLDSTPEELERSAKIMLSQYGTPEQIKALQDMGIIQPKKQYKQGTGVMSGYSYDPDTGNFSINPEVKASLEAKAAEKAAKGVKLGAKDRQSINKDVTSLIGDTVAIHKAAQSLKGLKKSSSPAAKLAAVFAFMKSLDPTSVVRESEQGQVYAASGAAEQLAGKINSMMGEGELSDAGFDDLVATAENLANSAVNASSKEVSNYLETYEDTIPDPFKASLLKRLPKSTAVNKTIKWSDM